MTGREPSKSISESIYTLKEKISSIDSKIDYNDKLIRLEFNSYKDFAAIRADTVRKELESYVNDKITELAKALQSPTIKSPRNSQNLWGTIAFLGLVIAILFIAVTTYLIATKMGK